MREAVVPLRFSFMALLTARKVTIFSGELVDLMSKMIDWKFEGEKKICKVKPPPPETQSTMSELKDDSVSHNDSIVLSSFLAGN